MTISTVFIQDGFHEGNTWIRLREIDTTEENPDHDSEILWEGMIWIVDERPTP